MLNLALIHEQARRLMGRAEEPPFEPGYRLHHGIRVEALSLDIAEAEALAVDRDILAVGARLHDIGKSDGTSDGHGVRGAAIVRDRFADLLPGSACEAVAAIVQHHYERPNSKWYVGRAKPSWPTSILAVQDADVIDHFGLPGIWIALHRATQQGRSPDETRADWFETAHQSSRRIEARQSLNFASSRRMLELRIAEMDDFFRRLI